MLFSFGPHNSLLILFVVPGAVATLWLLGRAVRRGAASDGWRSRYAPAELLPWRDELLTLMATEQPWLEPELTLTELAQRLRTNLGVLS